MVPSMPSTQLPTREVVLFYLQKMWDKNDSRHSHMDILHWYPGLDRVANTNRKRTPIRFFFPVVAHTSIYANSNMDNI